ncbi:uncharacterized protein [Trachinotus anak]|uniref:uncharacterized protein n=1 Tax=Trachinotus anak TaxID=443729 RepID=UPI0039F20065
MSEEISEKEWKKSLTSILKRLTISQYKEMLENLEKIPESLRNKSREKMPKIIIEHYGLHDSISAIHDAMEAIPRRDSAVQDLLRPFVDKLRKKQETESKGKKRKRVSESESEDEKKEPVAGFQKNNVISDSESSDEEQKAAADQQKSCKADQVTKIPPWRKTIHELRISGDLGQKAVVGKVVQKSALRTYQTKEKVKKFFFWLALADETSSIKVMVYGKERYQSLFVEKFYMFRDIIMDENSMKVTKQSTVSKTGRVDVPEELEVEAQMLIYRQSPVCSITKAKTFADKTVVSVEGIITEIGPVEYVKMKDKRRKKKQKQEFKLKDDTDFIRICLWGEDIHQLRGISDGDSVRVTNVKTSKYFETVSLNSTDYTRIVKVQSAAIQNMKIKIIGIISATKTETHLEAEFNGQVETLVVDSKLLAKPFGVRLEGDFEEMLLEKIPLSANAELKGRKINTITAI